MGLGKFIARITLDSFVPAGTRLVFTLRPSDESLGYALPPAGLRNAMLFAFGGRERRRRGIFVGSKTK